MQRGYRRPEDISKYSVYLMSGIGIAAAIAFVFALTYVEPPGAQVMKTSPVASTSPPQQHSTFSQISSDTGNISVGTTQDLKKFSSISEVEAFLSSVDASRNQIFTYHDQNRDLAIPVAPGPMTSEGTAAPAMAQKSEPNAAAGSSPNYSTTNIQVAGVDEPDIVKNDAKYAYILSGDKLTIIDAYPADRASVVSKIGLDIQAGQNLENMFLSNDTVVVFYQKYTETGVIPPYGYAPQQVTRPETHVVMINVTDRSEPKVIHDYQVDGTFTDARVVGTHLYLITSTTIDNYRQPYIPRIMEKSRQVLAPDVYYFDNPEAYYSFTTVSSFDISNATRSVISETYLTSPSSTIYVSENNVYLAYQKNNQPLYPEQQTLHEKDRFFQAVLPLLPNSVQNEIKSIENQSATSEFEKWDKISSLLQDSYNQMSSSARNTLFQNIQNSVNDYDQKFATVIDTTVIHKIAISNGNITYVARGEVPGTLLNQFSMDENKGSFRVATTAQSYISSQGTWQRQNNVYLLGQDMNVSGKLENIATGESIYSARFVGERLYLVTYQSVDPFFVIDLSGATPKVLGALNLQGYSDYLQPLDDTHILGIGRQTAATGNGAVINEGLKTTLFEVSNVTNPKVVDSYMIGDSSAYSEALTDHKAVLLSKQKGILVIPVSIPSGGLPAGASPETLARPYADWHGFYVLDIDSLAGIKLKGTIDHNSTDTARYYGYGASRSFFIDDSLYTVTTGNLFKANSLADLRELKMIALEGTGGIVPYPAIQSGSPPP